MAKHETWHWSEPTALTVQERITELRIRLVDGAVHVVGAPAGSPTRVEVSELSGEPLQTERHGGLLRVGYRDVSWPSLLSRAAELWTRRRHAVVSVSLPEDAQLSVGTVGAGTVISGLSAGTETRTVCGALTLTGLSGAVRALSTSGQIEAQSIQGSFRAETASGEVTLLDSAAQQLCVKTVSGRVTADLTSQTDIATDLTTVTGDVAVRLLETADATVRARTFNGALSYAFKELTSHNAPGRRLMTGVLGSGAGQLALSTVSGGIAVLRATTPPDSDDMSPSLVKES